MVCLLNILTSLCTSSKKSNGNYVYIYAGPIKYHFTVMTLLSLRLTNELISLSPLFFSTISSLLTLFSKFFSSFLRSTCSLSVSHKYLALEEVYLPFRAAIPNNPTLGVLRYDPVLAKYGVFTLYGAPFQGTYAKTIPSLKDL